MEITLSRKDAYSLLCMSIIIILLGAFVMKLSLEALVKHRISYIYNTEYFQIVDLKTTALMLASLFSGFAIFAFLIIMVKILLIL